MKTASRFILLLIGWAALTGNAHAALDTKLIAEGIGLPGAWNAREAAGHKTTK